MKKILIFLAVILFNINMIYGQTYNNEWIDYSKTYFKFKVGKTGLYRITQAQLAAIGLNNTDVSQFQLWRNGVEVPIFTSSQAGNIPSGGYLEFWGEMNDGESDNSVYRKPEYQLNNSKSLFTDTAAFFLTVNAAGNKRLAPTNFTIPAGATPEPYFMFTQSGSFFNELNRGKAPIYVSGGTVYYSSIDNGEGFASAAISNGNSMTQVYNNLFVYTGAASPSSTILFTAVGITPGQRNTIFSLNGTELINAPFNGFNWFTYNNSINTAAIAASTASFEIKNIASSTNQVRVAKLDITYPRQFNFGGQQNFKFQMAASSSGRYLEISNFSYSGTPVLYDLTEGKRYQLDITNPTVLKVFLPAFAVMHNFVLVNTADANINNIANFETRSFINYLTPANQGDYLIISNPILSTSSFGNNPLEDYKQYRSSTAGGSFHANIYMMDQLVDQFAFGVKHSPVAIRSFTKFARNKFASTPKAVLLLGKGVNYYSTRLNESNAVLWRQNLVPTFGFPASDFLLTAEGSSSYPLTPVGRLSVIDGDEINSYLGKVKEYEQLYTNSSGLIDDQIWKKNIAHVVGSNSQIEIEDFYERLNRQTPILKDTFYGAKIYDFVKQTINSNQEIASERLKRLFKEGFNLLSYLGHSTNSKLTFDLEDPYLYENTGGKYPVLNLMGCDAGDIYGWTLDRNSKISTISENYILAKAKGSIGLLSGTSYGYTSSVEFYYNLFAKSMSKNKYRATIGEIMQDVIKRTFEINPEEGDQYPFTQTQAEQCVLHGDPAIRFFNQDKPDYAIEDKTVSIEPNIVSIADGSFKVKAVMYNLGKALRGDLRVTVKRTTPDLVEKIIQEDTIHAIMNMDSITYTIPINQLTDGGMNKISITIDDNNQFDELFETNNTVIKEVFILEDGVRSIYPYNYQIVSKLPIVFAASTTNPLAEAANYLFEIDTTALFNSAQKTAQNVHSKGGLLEFSPTINYINNQVYYWRVAQEPKAGEQASWSNASFTFIPGTEGFSQGHFYQFTKGNLNAVLLDTASHKFEFGKKERKLTLSNGIWGSAIFLASELTVEIDDYFLSSNSCIYGLIFNVLDGKTLLPWANKVLPNGKGLYESNRPDCNVGRETTMTNFEFPNTAQGRDLAYKFLMQIPDGHYVVLRNQFANSESGNQYVDQWKSDSLVYGSGKTLYSEFIKQGLSKVDSINKLRAFNIIYKKNRAIEFSPLIQLSNDNKDKVILEAKLLATSFDGSYTTMAMGPVKKWNELFIYNSDQTNSENVKYELIGVSKSGNEQTLKSISNLLEQNNVDISDISASDFPYLKVKISAVDSINLTPFDIKTIRLSSGMISEGAIAPNLFFNIKDTLLPGEPLQIGIAFKNVSDIDFDKNMKIRLNILDRNNVQNTIVVPPQKILVAKDTIKFSYPINTQKYSGINTAFIEFNPDKDQPESNYLNNFLYKQFYVMADSTNPFMDVTFDGVRILNNDIVSSKPHIQVKLSDDAKWALLTDPNLVNLTLRYPNNTIREFGYTSDTLSFEPASNNNQNTATVHFKPYLLNDGKYELMVTGKDASGNKAGDIEYRVQFEVINKSMISNVLNYPNPFTTSTAFVFTLTGFEVPQNIRIQILTVTGKIVKEITKQELGSLRIGTNITEYKWDGTDQYGQKLANGVYLYRIITHHNGKSLDKFTREGDNTDKYFKQGYGKMYLMR